MDNKNHIIKCAHTAIGRRTQINTRRERGRQGRKVREGVSEGGREEGEGGSE